MLRIKIVAISLALFSGLNFTLCVIYGLIVPESLHAKQLLEMMLPGFKWISPQAYLLGLAETIIYALYVSILFVPIYNLINRRFHGHQVAKAHK